MRVVQYYPGAVGDSTGVTNAIAGWSRALAAAGHDVTVAYAGDRRPEGPRYGGSIRLRQTRHAGRGRSAVPVGLGPMLLDADLLVLHEGWVLSNVTAAGAARRAGVPYVVMPHGVYEPAWAASLRRPHRPRRALESSVLRRAKAVHVFFDSEVPQIQALAPGARCIVAPTGYDVPDARWRGGGDYLLWFGRYAVEHKGLDLLLSALAALPPARRPRLRLRGVDYRDGLRRVRDHVRVLELEDVVEVEGPVWGDEKLELLRDCKGYVHPSRWECHAGGLLECLAFGVPCLVSDRIHIAALLHRHHAALVCGLGREQLARGLETLTVADRDLGVRGRGLVERELAWPLAVRRFLDGLEDAGRA